MLSSLVFLSSIVGWNSLTIDQPHVAGESNLKIIRADGDVDTGDGSYMALNIGDKIEVGKGPNARLVAHLPPIFRANIQYKADLYAGTKVLYKDTFSGATEDGFEFYGDGSTAIISEPWESESGVPVGSVRIIPIGRRIRFIRRHGFAVGRSTEYKIAATTSNNVDCLLVTCTKGSLFAHYGDGTNQMEIVYPHHGNFVIPTPRHVNEFN